MEVLKGSVAQGSRLVPVVGPAVSYLVEELLNHRKRKLTREAVLLNEQEQDILFVIENAAHHKRLLLTIDGLDAWDDASWDLLALVLSSKLDELYPALKNAVILVGASYETPARLRPLIGDLPITEHNIRPLSRSDLPVALQAFGFPPVAPEDNDFLHDATGGRLDLLHDLARHLRETDLEAQSVVSDKYYDNLIDRRMQNLKGEARDLEEILAAAAVIGQTFAVDDLRCLIGDSSERLNAHLIAALGEIARFQSAALHRHFHRAHANEHAKYHGKFADCLRTMRPSDYGYRLHHLILANRIDDALLCYALGALASRRTRQTVPEPEGLNDAAAWEEVQTYLDVMSAAYEAYDERALQHGLQLLDTVEGFLDDVLIAERDYLEAQILLKSHKVTDFRRAVELLSRWRGLKEREAEVWSRIAQALMIALVQTDRLEEARRVEEEVTKHYWSRRRVDPWALYSYNTLRRRAECLHFFPTAAQYLERALSYFGPKEANSTPRHPLQYYYTLNNLVANLIASGRFADAHVRAAELDALVHDYPLIPWPTLEVGVNNFVLAGYLSGRVDAHTSVSLMETVLSNPHDGRGDRVLMENNYAVFLVDTGRPADARALLERTYSEVIAGGEPDAYHAYFVGNNLAALCALDGEVETAERLHKEIGVGLDHFYPAARQTLMKRHELITPAFAAAPELNHKQFDSYLIDHYAPQVGPQWAFYGRGFLFSDLQFWSAE
jgi:hypothetical protein